MKTVCRLVLAVAVSLSAAADAYGAVTSAGTLSPSGAQLQFTGLASSGGTLVAAGASATGNGGGEIDVFTEPAGGWSSESQAATLTDAAAMHGPFEPSISGGTVVANDAGATGASFDDVFVEPIGGWSGTVPPAARLVAPDGENLGDGVISGNTVVAFAANPQVPVSVLYVFVEPPGGWSGTVEPAATLTDSAGLLLNGPPVISDGSVFTAADSAPLPSGNVAVQRVDVFNEPAGGWAGTVHQSGALADIAGGPGPDTVSGDVVAAGMSLFRKPAGGGTAASNRSQTCSRRPWTLPTRSGRSPARWLSRAPTRWALSINARAAPRFGCSPSPPAAGRARSRLLPRSTPPPRRETWPWRSWAGTCSRPAGARSRSRS